MARALWKMYARQRERSRIVRSHDPPGRPGGALPIGLLEDAPIGSVYPQHGSSSLPRTAAPAPFAATIVTDAGTNDRSMHLGLVGRENDPTTPPDPWVAPLAHISAVSPNDYTRFIARRIVDENMELARRWLDRLDGLLPGSPRKIFPTETLLDHIPALISALARELTASEESDGTSNSAVVAKARELGEWRHAQGATIHQLTIEYGELACLLQRFVIHETDGYPNESPTSEALRVLATLDREILGLMRTTIDTYTERFAARIADQHERLASFNRIIGHDLRNPLFSVRLAASLLNTEEPMDPATIADVRRTLERSVDEILQILHSTRPLVELDDSLDPTLQAVELDALLDEVMADCREQAERAAVMIIRPEQLPAATLGLAGVKLILKNVLANAIEYADPAKDERWVRLSVSQEEEDGELFLLFAVRDNGIGIGDDEIGRVFERFARANFEHIERHDVPGNGLGLYIVQECVHAVGGTVDIASTLGEGTLVSVLVPYGPPDHTPAGTPATG